MTDALLVLNAGSSSLKFSVFEQGDPPELILRGQLEGLLTAPRFRARDAAGGIVGEQSWPVGMPLGHSDAIEFLFDWGRQGVQGNIRLVAAGHRVVHGGLVAEGPLRVTPEILEQLDALVPLAPLHQSHNLAAIRAVTLHSPGLPQVACFDTSFHHTQPQLAKQFALPRRFTDAGVLRFGFHGLSYEYIASQLPHWDAKGAAGRTIVAHLGNGASLCALQQGVSVATTMSFTPLDGIPMGTRCGAIDPGVLIHLMDRYGLDVRGLERVLTHESGLLGVSGLSSDMRTLLAHESTNPHAAEAIELFVYRICREIGSLAAALGGLDTIVFTGGIGEHATSVRARILRGCQWLGINLDDASNEHGGPRLTHPHSPVTAWAIPTNEELMIAVQTQRLLGGSPSLPKETA